MKFLKNINFINLNIINYHNVIVTHKKLFVKDQTLLFVLKLLKIYF